MLRTIDHAQLDWLDLGKIDQSHLAVLDLGHLIIMLTWTGWTQDN